MKNFVKLNNKAMMTFLVNHKNYPQEIFPETQEEENMRFKMWSRVVYDFKTGNFLKIGAGNLIMRAYHGYQLLTSQEIIKTYGQNPILKDFTLLSTSNDNFSNFHEFYEATKVPLISQINHLKKSEKFEILNSKNYKQIYDDITEACVYNWPHEILSKHEFNEPIRGYFLPALLSEPRHYLYKTDKRLLKKLKKLKEKGIKIFIISNNYYGLCDKLMTEAIGKNWLELFDFAIFLSKKPNFFNENIVKRKFIDIKGFELDDFTGFMNKTKVGTDKVLFYGHASYLNEHFKNEVANNYKILFFGDSIVADCVYAFVDSQKNHWEIGFIMEEIQEIEIGYSPDEYYEYFHFWGSALFDKNIHNGVDKTQLFKFANDVAHRSFSRLDSESCLEFLTL